MMQNDGPPRKKSGTPSWEVPVFVRLPRVLRCLLTAIHLYPRHNNVPAYCSDEFRTSSLNVHGEGAGALRVCERIKRFCARAIRSSARRCCINGLELSYALSRFKRWHLHFPTISYVIIYVFQPNLSPVLTFYNQNKVHWATFSNFGV